MSNLSSSRAAEWSSVPDIPLREIDKGLSFLWIDETTSTQSEAKLRVPLPPDVQILAIAAGSQTNGRGTKGREWFGAPGNVFLTVTLLSEEIPVPMSLVPLRVGVIVARAVQESLNLSPLKSEVNLKWPNDVLINQAKVAGILIEGDGKHLFIGIGVNVRFNPVVPQEGPQRGRPSTSIAAHGGASDDVAVQEMSIAIAKGLHRWINVGADSASGLRDEWSSMVDWNKQYSLRDDGSFVSPMWIEADGQLRVRNSDGSERLLMAEYLH
jgi:BirA family biotin operon repressor/biotin-[acetyl-CoA-carboxylase] ligase